MDAVVLREAGGFGDVIQIGSVVPLLRADGYTVHFYTMPDPAIQTLVSLIRGVSYVHPLRMVINDRRMRNDWQLHRHKYLRPVSDHVKGAVHGLTKNKLFDMFCPAWKLEQEAVDNGEVPGASRAQSYVLAAGYHPSETKPTRMKKPEGIDDFSRTVCSRVGSGYTVFAPWARDPCRSMRDEMIVQTIEILAESYGPVVVFAHGIKKRFGSDRPNVAWYPHDFGAVENRTLDMLYTVELMWNANKVVAVDSFPVHLAGALGKRIVSFDGPTFAEVNTRHYEHVTVCRLPKCLNCVGCYYKKSFGFSEACRGEQGCRVMGLLTSGDLRSNLEGAFG